mmetsp:Transcript_48538/g.113644  ORF Transcript_48538/g.113644 Transcript_48538/m.113644 type:complete len:426 (+) Transcript_48538:30-1307(+)
MTYGFSPDRERCEAQRVIGHEAFSVDRFFVAVQQAFEEQQNLEMSPSHQRPLRVSHQALSSVLASLSLLRYDERLDAEVFSRLVARLDPSGTGFIRCTAFLAFLSKALSHGMATCHQKSPKLDLRHVQTCVWDAVLQDRQMQQDFSRTRASSSPCKAYGVESLGEEKRKCVTPRSCTPERPTRAKWTQLEQTPPDLSDRCQLLYHQATSAMRASAAIEQEMQAQKLADELKECTFQPRLVSRRCIPRAVTESSPRRVAGAHKRPSSGSPRRHESSTRCTTPTKPRNFDSSVARMRCARKQKEELALAMEHVPCGENYERLRRMPVEPFSCFYRPRSARTAPLMYVDVNVGNGRTGRIGVHSGDDLHVLAENFAKVFQLDRRMVVQLEKLMRDACASILPHSAVPVEPAWSSALDSGKMHDFADAL